jgi:copper(I)-binding protein
MKRILILALAAVFLMAGCASKKGMEVQEQWSRSTQQGNNGAVYFTLRNHSAQPDELTGVSCDVADVAELHESKLSGDVMQMHKLESIPLPADTAVTFAPGGLHIMLIGLKKDLKVGEEFQITLHFKNHADIPIQVAVRDTPVQEDDPASTNY